MNGLKYTTGGGVEGVGHRGAYGLRVEVSIGRDLTPADSSMLAQKVQEMMRALDLETDRIDPKVQADIAKEKEDLRSLFPDPIYMTPIANGYGERPLYPWFEVMTSRGAIEIGWRRRVISIDWSKSEIRAKAESLFHDENVTKGDRSIHAWSYEKAKEYITAILGAK